MPPTVADIATAYRGGKLPDALTDPLYYNIKLMQSVRLGSQVPVR